MRTRFVMSAALLFIAASEVSFASVIDSANAYYVNIHYSSFANGKKVDSVLAHLGVQKVQPDFLGRSMTWEDVKDVKLIGTTDRFVGSVNLHANGYSGSISTILTPVVQYFVRFTDGSSSISDVFPIKVDSAPNFYIDYADDQARAQEEASRVARDLMMPNATEVVFGMVSFGNGWSKIDQVERASGILGGRPWASGALMGP